LTIEPVELRPLEPGEVLVDVACATICTSDLHTFTGRRPVASPMVLGHEMVGRVRSSANAPWLRGQRIVWCLVWSCGSCLFCQRELPQACETVRKFGHDPAPLMGGFADHCVLPAGTAIYPVPAALRDELAALAMCAGATAAAVVRAAELRSGDVVLVCGAGALGLVASAMAASGGACVVMAEPDPFRREQSVRFGANPRGALPARGADVVLELSGNPAAAEASLSILRKGGRLVLAGAVFPDAPLAWPAEKIVKSQLSIRGVYNYAPDDLRFALDFLHHHQHEFPFASLVQRSFALTEINEAFACAVGERPWRVAIYPKAIAT
jgi:putative phosphonate catabolism associated alcohol dehydrogenase